MDKKEISSKFEEKTQSDLFEDYSLDARASRLPDHYQNGYEKLLNEQKQAHAEFVKKLDEDRPLAVKHATLRELQKLNVPRLILDKENTSPDSLKLDAKMRATKSVANNYALRMQLLEHTQKEQRQLYVENAEKQLRSTKSLTREFNPSPELSKTFNKNKGMQR